MGSFPVTLYVPGKQETFSGLCTQLFPGGMYLQSDGPLPPLLAPVRARVRLQGAELEFACEVVRYVSSKEAATWAMPVGGVIQFLEATPALMEAISRAAHTAPAVSRPPVAGVTDAELRHLLRSHWMGEDEDFYELLGLEADADLSAARLRAKECRARLEAARSAGLDVRDRALLQPAIERVNLAMAVLADPMRRAEYDAARKNFHGVARCIAAGLTVTDLETCRRRHLARAPHAPKIARAYVEAAQALELKGKPDEALVNFERALAIDPLDLKLHLGYARARRALGQRPQPRQSRASC